MPFNIHTSPLSWTVTGTMQQEKREKFQNRQKETVSVSHNSNKTTSPTVYGIAVELNSELWRTEHERKDQRKVKQKEKERTDASKK